MNNDIVTVVCYGTERQMIRENAIKEFLRAMMCCEGSERDRYTNIYLSLMSGETYCTDEEF